jgi:hypothetical protein
MLPGVSASVIMQLCDHALRAILMLLTYRCRIRRDVLVFGAAWTARSVMVEVPIRL